MDVLLSILAVVAIIVLGSVVGIIVALDALDRRWRPIIRAYLEARAHAAGAVMRVADPDEPPGRIYAPLPPDEEEA